MTARAAAMFGHRVPEAMLTGRDYRVDDVRRLQGDPPVFHVDVRLLRRGRPVIEETLIVGPGRSLGGEFLPLVVTGVRPG